MGQGIAQILVFVVILIAASFAFSAYMARVFADGDGFLSRGRLRFLGDVERGFFRAIGDRTAKEQTWKEYAAHLLGFSFLFVLLLYVIQRAQGHLFLNPRALPGRRVVHLVQHRGELPHEHELAVLRRASRRCRT